MAPPRAETPRELPRESGKAPEALREALKGPKKVLKEPKEALKGPREALKLADALILAEARNIQAAPHRESLM